MIMKKIYQFQPIGQAMLAYGVLLLVLLGAFVQNANAQTPKGGLTFMTTEQAVENAPELNQLLFGINPAVSISSDGVGLLYVNSEEDVPVVAFCAPDAFNQLYAGDDAFANVVALCIQIKNGNEISNLDLARLNGFNNLAYVSITFVYDECGDEPCLLPIVQNMIIGTMPVNILYQLSIPN